MKWLFSSLDKMLDELIELENRWSRLYDEERNATRPKDAVTAIKIRQYVASKKYALSAAVAKKAGVDYSNVESLISARKRARGL